MLDACYPASVTKLMTALIVLEHCEMSEEVVISKEVAEFTRGSVTELREGDVLTVQDLLSCMLVESANNAALSLAIYVAGSEAAFANMMNWEMDRLGGSGSHFVNASGLHNERHFATPYPVILVECFIGHLVNDLVHNLVTINREMIREGSGIYLFSWDEMSVITKVNFERRFYQTMPGILVALILIFFYSKKKGKQLPKAFYYMFYPVHLIAIFFLMKIFF